MDLYELEVKNLLKEGGNERLKSQFMNLSRRLDEVSIENKELKKQISELEAQIERDKELLEVKTVEVSISEDKILSCLCPYCGKIVAGKIPNGYKVDEEPLPFSSEERGEDRIDKIEKAVLGIQSFLKKETEQKIKELEEEQKRLMREAAHQRFISDLVRPLKP